MADPPHQLQHVGYIKYTGKSVEDGVIDAGSAGSALTGLDEALRFFNTQQSPDFATLDYEIPVQTRPGSWEAIVLGGVAVIGAIGTAWGIGYARKAGEKMAENDFKEIGLKDVLQKSMTAMKTLAELVKHTRRSQGWQASRFSMEGPVPMVAIPNERGEELFIPAEFFRWFQDMPPKLLFRLTSVIRAERILSIGLSDQEPDRAVVIREGDKPFFDVPQDEEIEGDVLFPELIHGKSVRIEGRLIRGSEASNSLGLEYQGHVINCVPAKGSVRQYKSALFLKCRVHAQVSRLTKSRFVIERRPTLIVEKVIPLEKDGQGLLFEA